MRTALIMLLLMVGSAAQAQPMNTAQPAAGAAAAEAATPQAPLAVTEQQSAEAANGRTGAGSEARPVQQTVASATVADAAVTEVLSQVPVVGTLVAREEVQVYPQVTGFEIREILVEAGDHVRQGQVLARLASETLAAQLAQADAEQQRAEAAVGQARSQIASTAATLTQVSAALERASKLQRSGSTTQAALDQAIAADAAARAASASAANGLAVAQAQLAQAAAAREIARLNLARAEVKAPLDGSVLTRDAQLGAIAGGGATPMFTLIAGGEIELAAETIETALPQIEAGNPVIASIAGIGEVPGKVRLIPSRVDPLTRLGVLRISLQDDAGRFRPGLSASALITTQRHRAVTVPATAVLSDGRDSSVLVVRDNRIETRTVDAGLIWQGQREIRAGLAAGETVVARAGAFFRHGDPVRPVRADAPGAPAGAFAAAGQP